MNSRERVLKAINFTEPDHIPFDLGGTYLSTINVSAYKNLRKYLGLSNENVRIGLTTEQLVLVDEDIADRFETDVRLVVPGDASDYEIKFRDEGRYEAFTDEWGIGRPMPKDGGLFYDMYFHPLSEVESLEELKKYPFPNPIDDSRFTNLRSRAEEAAAKDKAVTLGGPCAGIVEMYMWTRGYEQFYVDLAWNQEFVTYMLNRLVEYKSKYWKRALEEVGDLVDIVIECDDLGLQNSLMLSPTAYRKLIKPYHKKLFHLIKDQAPVKIFFHSCGSIRPIIGDLIDAGIDILNPIQISAKGMDPLELKKEFGKDLVFWGGGVETQRILNYGTTQEIKDNVKQNIDALAPGGGFVFAAVMQIQADVPPENIIAMWEAWKENGVY